MMASRFLYIFAVSLLLAFAPVAAHAALDKNATPEEAARLESAAGESAQDAKAGASASSEHGAAQAGHGENKSGGLPQLNIQTFPSQIFWLLVMFTVLYTAFSKSVLPGISAVVDGRDRKIKNDLAEAEDIRKQAGAVQDAYEKSLQNARAAALKAVQDVEAAAKKAADDHLQAFRDKSEKEIAATEAKVESAKDKAMAGMNSVAAEVASIAAQKVAGISTDVQKAHAIVETIASKAKAA